MVRCPLCIKHTGNVQTSGFIARGQIKSLSVDKLFWVWIKMKIVHMQKQQGKTSE